MVGLYSNELVAAPNPRVGEEAVLDAAVGKRFGLEAAEIGSRTFQNRRRG
jgi:hypothetical protein